jgi:RimJ/RimL family protein N-acetyltransferase
MTHFLEAPTLEGSWVRLEPLAVSHAGALAEAAVEDRQTYRFTPVPRDSISMGQYVANLLAERDAGAIIPFAQVDASDSRVVGVTRFMTFRYRGSADVPYAVEIGGTWLASSAQRSPINTEAKLLLMTHAFDNWKVTRLDFKSDARNERSRSAILRIGAKFEGVLRHWQPSMVSGEEELYRDTAMYSVLDSEWPVVRANLQLKLS